MNLNSNSHRDRNSKIRLIICVAVFLLNGICAFQLSMVASRSPISKSFDGSPSSSPGQNSNSIPSSSGSVSSSLISNLAVLALKRRLECQTSVSCDVTASSSDVLLKGQVGPVTVKGRGWGSRLGLTCRAIEAAVDVCKLDVSRIISNQKLVLTTPAEGNAMVALNAIDFGNFVTHPLMKPPGLPGDASGHGSAAKLEFLKDGALIDHPDGSVGFLGTYLEEKWQFTLRRGSDGKQAQISVTPLTDASQVNGIDAIEIAEGLAEVTSTFFNEMVFELDGTFLSFRDMMVTDKGKEPCVMLSLRILVRKFPSPGLEF